MLLMRVSYGVKDIRLQSLQRKYMLDYNTNIFSYEPSLDGLGEVDWLAKTIV